MLVKHFLTSCGAVLLALSLGSTANTDLYLMLNIGDNEDREVPDAGITLTKAQDGVRPPLIESTAVRYFVPLPHATINTLSGSARRVGASSTDQGAIQAVESISEGTISASASPPRWELIGPAINLPSRRYRFVKVPVASARLEEK